MNNNLLPHYLTVALRSLERYKSQSVISVIGLAVGFVCLALSSVWVRWENTFDNFHPGADRMYMVWDKGLDELRFDNRMPRANGALKAVLPRDYPEVENACYYFTGFVGEKEGFKIPVRHLYTDTTFFSMFSLSLVEGEIHGEKESIYISDEYAWKRFGTESPIGKPYLSIVPSAIIDGVFKGFHHSSLSFDLLGVSIPTEDATDFTANVIVRLKNGTDVRVFEAKLNAIDNDELRKGEITLIPLSHAGRYMRDVAMNKENLSYRHLRFFQLVSALLVACVFINFLVLFLIRVRGRQREMALRMVHGAKPRMLLEQFVVELLLTLGLALALGLFLTFAVKDIFAEYAGIDLAGGYIMGNALLFMAVIAVVCLIIATVSVEVVRRSTIRHSLMPGGGRRNNTFTKVCTGVQLAMSLTLVCCSAFMLKKLYFMKNTDWGYDIKGHMHFQLNGTRDPEHPDTPLSYGAIDYDRTSKGLDVEMMDRLRKLPYVHSAKSAGEDPIGLYERNFGGRDAGTFFKMRPMREGETPNDISNDRIVDEGMPITIISIDNDLSEAGLTVVEGALPINPRAGDVAITERTRELLGVESAVGMQLMVSGFSFNGAPPQTHHYTVKAVVKDIYLDSPTQAAPPYILGYHGWTFLDSKIAVRYDPAHRAELAKELTAMFDEQSDMIFDMVWHEDEWAELMRSEQNLSRLLTVVSLVAVLIAVFGVYSIITLACRQRRKEIALRKIHGAKLRDILSLFIKEYGLILLAGAFVAFTVSYIVMHGWLEQYIKRTPLSLWVFVAILVATALLIALCVGSRVWRTARENPADVIKSE